MDAVWRTWSCEVENLEIFFFSFFRAFILSFWCVWFFLSNFPAELAAATCLTHIHCCVLFHSSASLRPGRPLTGTQQRTWSATRPSTTACAPLRPPGCTAAQLALAWVLHQGKDVAPIPGEHFSGCAYDPVPRIRRRASELLKLYSEYSTVLYCTGSVSCARPAPRRHHTPREAGGEHWGRGAEPEQQGAGADREGSARGRGGGGRYPEHSMKFTWAHADTPRWNHGSPRSE